MRNQRSLRRASCPVLCRSFRACNFWGRPYPGVSPPAGLLRSFRADNVLLIPILGFHPALRGWPVVRRWRERDDSYDSPLSFPQISLVVVYMVRLKHIQVFLAKCPRSVVFFLSMDIANQHINIRFPQREGSVTRLP